MTRKHCLTSLLVAFSMSVFCVACSSSATRKNGDKKNTDGKTIAGTTIFVGVPPLAYVAERVGGTRVVVEVLTPAGGDPHHYEPSPRQVVALGRADLYFSLDLPFEHRLTEKLAAITGGPRVIPLYKELAPPRIETTTTAKLDPHAWLSPQALKVLATGLCRELKADDDAHAAEYEANLRAFLTDLERTDAEVRRILAPFKGRELFVFHPAFGWFAAAYGLRQTAMEREGKRPGPRRLARLIAQAKREGVKTVFAEKGFSRKSADLLARALGGRVVLLNPLARDCLRNLKETAEKIAAAWRAESVPAGDNGH